MAKPSKSLLVLLVFFLGVGKILGSETEDALSTQSTMWQWYKAMLVKRPLLTKASTSAAIMSFSDVLCQSVEGTFQSRGHRRQSSKGSAVEKRPVQTAGRLLYHQDWDRTAQVAITGFAWSGPATHTWYTLLEKMVRVDHRLLGIAVRMVLDAVVFSPIAVAGYFTCRTLLSGEGLSRVADKLQSKWTGAVLKSWQFWPAANVINFSIIPLQFRVLYSNMLSAIWNAYMSHMNEKIPAELHV